MNRNQIRAGVVAAFAAGVVSAILLAQTTVPSTTSPDILRYIDETWSPLTRSDAQLASAAVDPKFRPERDGRWPVYIPSDENFTAVRNTLAEHLSPAAWKTIDLKRLPENSLSVAIPGLLYLPRPYVVPGGRFNEMYGWDSYFIQVGLLRDNKLDLAKDMADNALYEVKHYGKVLNANRTYYLSRSQPPFLTEMVLGVYRRTHDRQWLENALPQIEKYYQIWVTEPHLTKESGLARYFDLGEGPAPEVVSAERDPNGKTHYELVKAYFKSHTVTDYDVSQYYDRRTDGLKPLFYKGDRSMRESGFDPSNRFGEFNIDIIHYDPVCLNSLLYLAEQQTAEILDILGKGDEAGKWKERAKERAGRINKLMWDEKDGFFYDYNFVGKRVRKYHFLTPFYPLWAGLASKRQAARGVQNLELFERTGGLQTSTNSSGNQWYAPFGWAPVQLIAVDGLRRYGFTEEAERVSMKFLKLVRSEFLRQGFIVEKYDVVQGGSNVSSKIHYGYSANQAGFGWTNAAFTTLYDELTPAHKQQLLGE